MALFICLASVNLRGPWSLNVFQSTERNNILSKGRQLVLLINGIGIYTNRLFNGATFQGTLHQVFRLLFGRPHLQLFFFCFLRCFLLFKFKLLAVFIMRSYKHPHKVLQSRNNYKFHKKHK